MHLNLNPNDKSTVISIVTFDIMSVKPSLYPGRFSIPKGTDENPTLIEVGQSVHYVMIQDDMPHMPVITPSSDIARAIVEDYKLSSIVTTPDAGPGLMWLTGIIKKTDLLTKYKKNIEELIAYQRRWYTNLVQLADDDWQKYKNHKVISDIQRHACIELKLNREWLVRVIQQGIKCPACGMMNDPEIVICNACRCVLNKDKWKELQFA